MNRAKGRLRGVLVLLGPAYAFYDFNRREVEFSFGTYLNFNREFRLTTLKRERADW